MSALDWVTIQGFKSIKSIERLPLGRINVLIGPNGSGKSNFIDALSFLHAISMGKLQSYVGRAGGAEKILHFGSKETYCIFMEFNFDEQESGYEVMLSPTDDDNLYPSSESERGGPIENENETYMSGIGGSSPHIREFVSSWRLYHFHDTSMTSPMRKTSDIHDNRGLRAEGENLASFLFLLQEKHKNSYEMIRRTVHLVAPFLTIFY